MSLARVLSGAARRVGKAHSVRWYAVPANKDLVKELYLREVRQYKPVPMKVDTADVKELLVPTAPQAPAIEDDVTSALAAYDIPEEAAGAGSRTVGLMEDKTHSTYPLDVIYEEECREWESVVAERGPMGAGDRLVGIGGMAPEQFHAY